MPYRFFNAIAEAPPMLGVCTRGVKRSVTFAGKVQEFVRNLVTFTPQTR